LYDARWFDGQLSQAWFPELKLLSRKEKIRWTTIQAVTKVEVMKLRVVASSEPNWLSLVTAREKEGDALCIGPDCAAAVCITGPGLTHHPARDADPDKASEARPIGINRGRQGSPTPAPNAR